LATIGAAVPLLFAWLVEADFLLVVADPIRKIWLTVAMALILSIVSACIIAMAMVDCGYCIYLYILLKSISNDIIASLTSIEKQILIVV
jgi:hypothetical protein